MFYLIVKIDYVVFTGLHGSLRAYKLLGSSSCTLQFLCVYSQYKGCIAVQQHQSWWCW